MCVSSGCSKHNKKLKISDMENYGYKLYFRYDDFGSIYDKDGRCYSGIYKKDDCERELIEDDDHTIEFVKSNGYKNGLAKYLKFKVHDFDGKIKTLEYSSDSEIISDELVYVYTQDREYVRLGYECYYEVEVRNKSEDASTDHLEKCSGKKLKKTEEFANNYKKVLKDLDTNSDSILKLMNEVDTDIVIPRKKGLINKEPLSVDEFVKYVQKRNFTIERLDDSVAIFSNLSSTYFGELYFLLDKDNNVNVMYYVTDDSSKTYIVNYTNGDDFVMFKDSACRYNAHNPNLSTNCTSEETIEGDQWYFSFEALIKSFRLLTSELPEYIKMYAQKY